MRRDRAARLGPELFLFERVFADCLERIALIEPPVRARAADRLPRSAAGPSGFARSLQASRCRDPAPLFAEAAGGEPIVEDAWEPEAGAYDLVLAIGTLDTVNDLPLALRADRACDAPGRRCSSARCPAATPCRNFARRCAPRTRSAGGGCRTSIRGSRRRRWRRCSPTRASRGRSSTSSGCRSSYPSLERLVARSAGDGGDEHPRLGAPPLTRSRRATPQPQPFAEPAETGARSRRSRSSTSPPGRRPTPDEPR